MKGMLTLEAFEEASEIVRKVTTNTKLIPSGYFSAQSKNKVFLKPENMQVTGAYKIRDGVKATIVMPTTTPLIKVNRTRGYGAEVILKGDVYNESCEYALKLAKEEGYTFVHPFDDPTVATGQGTIMMEIFKDLPTVEYVLVPVG